MRGGREAARARHGSRFLFKVDACSSAEVSRNDANGILGGNNMTTLAEACDTVDLSAPPSVAIRSGQPSANSGSISEDVSRFGLMYSLSMRLRRSCRFKESKLSRKGVSS
jgi:hypothetical protein